MTVAVTRTLTLVLRSWDQIFGTSGSRKYISNDSSDNISTSTDIPYSRCLRRADMVLTRRPTACGLLAELALMISIATDSG